MHILGDFSNCRRCTAKRGTITQHPTDPRIEGIALTALFEIVLLRVFLPRRV